MTWTRRRFIASSASAALVTHIEPASASVTDDPAPDRLRAVMDEIIPRQGNMPSASEAGGVQYFSALKKTEPALASEILVALDRVGTSSPLVEALQQLEREDPGQFALLRDFVYEAYYIQPQVWKLIGYQFYPTDHQGPYMKPFDEAVISQVRTKPRFYREV